MPSSAASAYRQQAVSTATGPRLLVMLCERLAIDVARATVAVENDDLHTCNESLQHAQRIVRVLRQALNPDGFRGGHELMSVYVFLERHLLEANMSKSRATLDECARLIEPIRDAWTRAVDQGDPA